jgi:hypothetical protein
MKHKDFLSYVRNKEIPPEPPDGTSIRGYDYRFEKGFPDNIISYWNAREECVKLGMWAIVDDIWTKVLADWIGNRIVLEIMSGPGWLAKALTKHGVRIISTDNFSWEFTGKSVYSLVLDYDAVKAVKKYFKSDILLCSWPPYENDTIVRACDVWGPDKPIIYIGEGEGGCCAPDAFFTNFREIEPRIDIPLKSWYGIHDTVMIGNWTRGQTGTSKVITSQKVCRHCGTNMNKDVKSASKILNLGLRRKISWTPKG